MKKYRSRTIIVVSVCVAIVIIFIIGGMFLKDNTSTIVEKNDLVQIDYTVWESDNSRSYDIVNPVLDNTLWVTLIPITENDTTGLILGLYNNLLGKELYYESNLIWLDQCIDENRDGIDDLTNATALSYGNSTDQYYNTCLMIQFKILDIEKAPQKAQEFPIGREELFLTVFLFFIIICIVFLPIVLISIPIIYRNRINRLKVLKYGLMVGFVGLIQIIAIWLINLTLPPPPYLPNPFFLPILIAFLFVLGILSIVIYLILYKIIELKIRRKRA